MNETQYLLFLSKYNILIIRLMHLFNISANLNLVLKNFSLLLDIKLII